MRNVTRRCSTRKRRRAAAAASIVLLALTTGCGLLSPPKLDSGEAGEHYAGLPEAIREALDEVIGDIPPDTLDAIPYSGSVESCSWYPGSITVPDDLGPTLLDDVAEIVQPVLMEYGFEELRDGEQAGVEPYLVSTDDHGAEITVSRRGDVRVGIEIPIDTGGRECDSAVLT